MKALTLTQPWATLVITGRKRVETRSWRPVRTVIGRRVAIHAAKGMPGWAIDAAIEFGLDAHLLPRGAVLGTVAIADVLPTEEIRDALSDQELAYGDYSPGRFAWLLEDPHRLEEPRPATGALGFWEWNPFEIPGKLVYATNAHDSPDEVRAAGWIAPTSVGGTDG